MGVPQVIIDAVEELRKNTAKHRKCRFYFDFYFPVVEALIKIGTKKDLFVGRQETRHLKIIPVAWKVKMAKMMWISRPCYILLLRGS